MAQKSDQLQIRVTRAQKAALKRLAADAGLDVSSYVLGRALPPAGSRFEELVGSLGSADHRFVLADLNDFLSALAAVEFSQLGRADVEGLSPFLANYVAAMVEQAAAQKGVLPPSWTKQVPPLGRPYFAVEMAALRPYLLRSSPVPFKKRNLFVDAAVGTRV